MFRLADYVGEFSWRTGTLTLQSNSIVQIRPPDLTRAYLVIGNPNNQVVIVSPSAQLTTAGGPFVVPVNTSYELFWERHGELLCEAWYGFAKGLATPIYWLELLWQPTMPQSTSSS